MPADRIPQECEELDNLELTRLFAASGSRYGFSEVTADYAAFKDFKVKWTRSYRWATFEVSDYLSDAPAEMMRPLSETVYKRISGEKVPYPAEVREWLSAPGFVQRKRPLYIRRFEEFVPDPYGTRKDLTASLKRLVSTGLVKDDPEVLIGWSSPNPMRSAGTSSIIMKTASVSTALDKEYVIDDVLDYCLYAMLARISMGLNPGTAPRGDAYEDLLDEFPGRARMESELRLLRLHI